MNALERVEEIGSTTIALVYGRWTEQLLTGEADPRTVRKRLAGLQAGAITQTILEGRLRGLMLGFLSGVAALGPLALQDTRTTPVETKIVEQPLSKASQAFRQRVPVTRESWDALTAKERRRAFTVSGLAKADYVATAQEVVAKAIDEGWAKKDFVDKLETRFKEAGLDPLNPSHAETVFRTNVNTAHADGRMGAFTQPAVLKARPFWEWTAIVDKHTRSTHKAMSGCAMAAMDPAWQLIAPPCGFNCRCSIRPIKESQASQIVTGADARVQALPDEGWEPSGAPFGQFELSDGAMAAE